MRGFTLMELVITMGIISVIGVLLLIIIINSAGVFYKQSSKVTEGLNINDALSQIRESIKQSNSIANSYIVGLTNYTSGTTELILRIPSIDPSNNIIPNTYDFFVFFLEANILRLKVFPDALSSRKAQDRIFSTSVSSLKFQYLNLATPPAEVIPAAGLKVRTTLTLRQKNGLNYETNTATSEANLRNM